MNHNLNSSIKTNAELAGSLSVNEGMSIKGALSQKLGLVGSISTMNLYNYYTKEEIHELFSTIVTVRRDSYFNFPNVGNEGVLYIDVSQNSTYVWDNETVSYQCIGRDYEKIRFINGGSAKDE